MKNKKGISLMILILTIIVMIILASTVIFISSDATNDSKVAALASDLTGIEDVIEEYYLTNNQLPIVSGISYSKAQVISLISAGSSVLSEEITENGDDAAVFYEVDLTELPIDSSHRGTKKDGDTTDIYLVSSQNFNVYYLKGEKIRDEYYFSLSSKLTGKTKVDSNDTVDASNITISTVTSGIKLAKSTSDWTNALTVKIETTLETNETLEYLVAGQSAGTSTSGEFTINLAEILNGNATLRNTFYASDANKVLTVNKYSSVNGTKTVIATATINISNLDVLSGSVVSASNITYTKYDTYTLANIAGYTDLGGSGVKEARVVYTQKLDSDGNAVSYYEDLPTQITAEYVKNAGKTFNFNILRLPSDVTAYAIVFIDNAGNTSALATYSI